MTDLEERLRSHAQAFDGLLALIPAKYYYGEDTSDQWQRKKQTKEQARNAKRAKLDPDFSKTAKDVMDENTRKRKREDGNEPHSPANEIGSELPKESLKRGNTKPGKPKKNPATGKDPVSRPIQGAADGIKVKTERKTQRRAIQREKKAKEVLEKDTEPETKTNASTSSSRTPNSDEQLLQENIDNMDKDALDSADKPFPVFRQQSHEHNSTTSSSPISCNFDTLNPDSGTSSISSIIPPSAGSKPLKATPEELRIRLQKRLDELRAARHADGLNGKPARNRQELIEARRLKAEQRRAHKKELRRKAKEEEQRLKDEAMMRRFSPGGSGSLLASPHSPAESNVSNSNNYSFGRIAFADGQQVDSTLSHLVDQLKPHGPQDPGTALKAAEAKKARLTVLDPTKRVEIEEKDMWLNAKKRVHGERVRDDTSLLKKALKRKVSAKKKSGREWKERLEGVAKSKEMKRRQRDENIRKRKEEKGKKAGKGKARPGFEGTFRTKVGAKKK